MENESFALRKQEKKVQDAALIFFGDHIFQAERYVRHLATSGIARGLLGPNELSKVWTRHVLNCAVIQECVAKGISVADVGSGAGLPGIVLAIARPDLEITLIEPLKRRTVWLHEIISDLGLDNVNVVRCRAEDIRGRLIVDVVTARAVTSLKNLIGISLPLLSHRGEGVLKENSLEKQGGKLVAIKGSSVFEELRAADGVLEKLGLKSKIKILGEGLLEEPTRVVEVLC